jgi:hypothetical protein
LKIKVLPKRRLNFNGLNDVISQNLVLIITAVETTSNFKFYSLLEFTFLTAVVTICTTYFNKLKLCVLPIKCICCVPYGSHSKQRLFSERALTCWAHSEDVICFLWCTDKPTE